MSCNSSKGEDTSSKEVVVDGMDDHHGPLPGFRFHPTDDELVSFYLKRKVYNKPLSIEIIKEIDIYKHDPWDLIKGSNSVGDKEWYFYCKRGRKYRNSVRPNRVTGSGFWKATGIDRPIYSNGGEGQHCVGLKKSLVYYRGSAGKGTKTDWMMHEFRLPTDLHTHEANSSNLKTTLFDAEIWTLCRIFKRNKRQTPDWRELSTRKNGFNLSSKPISMDSNPNNEHYINFGTRPTTSNHDYSTINESININKGHQYNNYQPHWNPTTNTTTPVASNSSTLNVEEDYEDDLKDLYRGNWDDLNSVVEFAVRTPLL